MTEFIPWVQNLAETKIKETAAYDRDWLILERLGMTQLPKSITNIPELKELYIIDNLLPTISPRNPQSKAAHHPGFESQPDHNTARTAHRTTTHRTPDPKLQPADRTASMDQQTAQSGIPEPELQPAHQYTGRTCQHGQAHPPRPERQPSEQYSNCPDKNDKPEIS